MMPELSGQEIKRVLFEVIREFLNRDVSFQQNSTLREAVVRLKISGTSQEQALLTLWYDLFRQGLLAWGFNLTNPDPPFCHLTESGHEVLRHLSRDPYNPDGYLKHLLSYCSLSDIANSYIQEALMTYAANCLKATSVMVGCASEAIILDLRDAIIARLNTLGRTVSNNLIDWRIKNVIKQIQEELDRQKINMPRPLPEEYESYFTAFVGQIRLARNEAGHPSNIDPVAPETVHASLLIFPELARLAHSLKNWINSPLFK